MTSTTTLPTRGYDATDCFLLLVICLFFLHFKAEFRILMQFGGRHITCDLSEKSDIETSMKIQL